MAKNEKKKRDNLDYLRGLRHGFQASELDDDELNDEFDPDLEGDEEPEDETEADAE